MRSSMKRGASSLSLTLTGMQVRHICGRHIEIQYICISFAFPVWEIRLPTQNWCEAGRVGFSRSVTTQVSGNCHSLLCAMRAPCTFPWSAICKNLFPGPSPSRLVTLSLICQAVPSEKRNSKILYYQCNERDCLVHSCHTLLPLLNQ